MTNCPRCGAENLDNAQYCQACGNSVTAAGAAPMQYAGFWAPVGATLIDFIILSFAAAVLLGSANIAGGFASLFLPWIYEALMQSSKKQATVGKIVLGLIVTDGSGRPISFARATARHFAKYLSGLILGIGFIMAAFTDRKQALHDMIADTLVVQAPPR